MAQKNTVGDVGMDLILLAAIGLGAYWAYTKFFGPNAKQQAQDSNNKTVEANTNTANQTAQNTNVPPGQTPSLDTSTINSITNSIITEINGVDISDLPDQSLGSQLLQLMISLNNTADYYAIVTAFGTRKLNDGTSVDLVTALRKAMTQAQIADLDSYLSGQSINVYI